jgi:hypothetical protein
MKEKKKKEREKRKKERKSDLFSDSVDGEVGRRLEAVVGSGDAKLCRTAVGETEEDLGDAGDDHLRLSFLAGLQQLHAEV